MGVFLFLLLAALIVFLNGVHTEHRFTRLARSLDLEFDGRCVVGTVDGLVVRIAEKPGDDQVDYQLILGANALAPIDARPRNLFSRVEACFGGAYLTGDAEFDEAALVQGDTLVAAAALSTKGRRAVLRLLSLEATLENGTVTLLLKDSELSDRLTRELLEQLARAARVLKRRGPEALLKRLARNALSDPIADVRRKNLELLVQRWPIRPPLADRVLVEALADGAASVRLLAAEHAGFAHDPDGAGATVYPVLLNLTEGCHPVAVRVEALRVLAARFDLSHAPKTLIALLRDPSDRVRRATAEALTAHGWAADHGALAVVEPEGGELGLAPSASKR